MSSFPLVPPAMPGWRQWFGAPRSPLSSVSHCLLLPCYSSARVVAAVWDPLRIPCHMGEMTAWQEGYCTYTHLSISAINYFKNSAWRFLPVHGLSICMGHLVAVDFFSGYFKRSRIPLRSAGCSKNELKIQGRMSGILYGPPTNLFNTLNE